MAFSIHEQELDEMAQVANLLDLATGWFEPWYFRVRLEEEVDRVCRYGQPASVIHIKLPPTSSHVGDELWTVREQLAEIAFDGLRTSDIPGKLDDFSYAILLPGTGKEGAMIAARRLTEKLGAFAPIIRVLTLPDDLDQALELCKRPEQEGEQRRAQGEQPDHQIAGSGESASL